MRPPYRKPSVAGSVVAALLLSLGLHGLIVLGVWLAPVSQPASPAVVDPTQVPQDYPALGLDRAPPPVAHAPGSPLNRPDTEVKPASFDVKMVDPPPSSPGPAAPRSSRGRVRPRRQRSPLRVRRPAWAAGRATAARALCPWEKTRRRSCMSWIAP